jgi:hypothetical protein
MTLLSPTRDEMVDAFLKSDGSFDGLFYTAVRTTGIFCIPSCRARKPLPQNVEFFETAREALFSGYRPCKRCRPMESNGASPEWLRPLIEAIEQDPQQRWPDAELEKLGLTVTPSVGNFILIHFPKGAGKTAKEADAFLTQRGLILRSVAAYGLPDALRMTIGSEEANRAVVAALGVFVGNG